MQASRTKLVEQKELDLSKAADVGLFLESVRDVYAEALQYEAAARAEEYDRLEAVGVTGSDLYESLREKVHELQSQAADCEQNCVQAGQTITDDQVDHIQKLYNELATLRNIVRDAYEEVGMSTPAAEPVSVSEPVAPTPVQSAPVSAEESEAHQDSRSDTAVEGHRQAVRAELARLMKKRKVSKIKQRLDRTIGTAQTIDEINHAREKLLQLLSSQPREKRVEKSMVAAPVKRSVGRDESSTTSSRTKTTEKPFSARRKDMQIDTDTDEKEVVIQVSKKAERVRQQSDESILSFTPKSVQDPTSLVHKAAPIVAAVEEQDPINSVVPDTVPTVVHARPELAETSLTKRYLEGEPYRSFILEHYSSPEAFERILDTIVTQIETETVDVFERWLQEQYASPFTFIQDMTVAAVEELGAQPEVRGILKSENIKYETFVTWVDLIPEMQTLVGAEPNMTIGELYTRWMVESAMRQAAA